MKKIESTDEKKLMEGVENGDWKPIKNFEDLKKKLIKAAAKTALKDYRMNIRISKRDIEALKVKALEDGIPYQTLVTSILHKYVVGKLIEKR